MIKLVVGLGNPGIQYELTRHNIGWLALDQLSFYDHLQWKDKFQGSIAQKSFAGENAYFLKPATFMNLSGQSVVAAAQFFKIAPDEILVVHDELDLPYGEIAFKKGGGSAGHNGLKSMIGLLGTPDFHRVRLGIGRPPHGNVSAWVLQSFSTEEEKVLPKFLKAAADAIEEALEKGLAKASSKFSRKNFNE